MFLRHDAWFRMLLRDFANSPSRELPLAIIAVLRRILLALAAFALVFGVSGWTALAQSGGVSLNAGTVENFVASYAAVRAKADELSTQYNIAEGDTVAAGWRAWVGVEAARGQLDAAVGSYGFSDFSLWVQALSMIARAYAFTSELEATDIQMTEDLERIRADPNIPAAQREMMLQQLQHSLAIIALMRPSPENIEAVTPHLDRLAVIFDEDG